MKRNNKFMAYALAGAMAISNLGALAIPMTAFAGFTTGVKLGITNASAATRDGSDSGAKAIHVGDVLTFKETTGTPLTAGADAPILYQISATGTKYDTGRKFATDQSVGNGSFVVPATAAGKTINFEANDGALITSGDLNVVAWEAPAPANVKVLDTDADGEDKSADSVLAAKSGKDYAITLTLADKDLTDFTPTADAGGVVAGKLDYDVEPSNMKEIFKLDLSSAKIVRGNGVDERFSIDKVVLKIDGSKTATLKSTDVAKIKLFYKDSMDESKPITNYTIGGAAGTPYQVTFGANEKASDNINLALYETDTLSATGNMYTDGIADGNLTYYVRVAGDTKTVGLDLPFGSITNGKLTLLNPANMVDYKEDANPANKDKYFLVGESDAPSVFDVVNKGSSPEMLKVGAGKNGTANLTVTLKKLGATGDVAGKDVTTITSIKIPVVVTGKSGAVTIYNTKNSAITTGEVTAKEPTLSVKAGYDPLYPGFDATANVIWVSEDEDVISVAGNGLDATITGIGNSSAGVKVYAVVDDNADYITAYAKAIKAGDKEKVAVLKAAQAAAKGTNTLTVKSSDFALAMTATKQLDLFVNGAKSSAITATVNDRKYTAIGYDKSATQTSIKLTFKSNDEKVATVDNTGVVTPVAAGKTTITVTGTYKVSSTSGLVDATIEATVPVTVTDAAAQAAELEEAKAAADKATADKAAAETAKKAAEDKAAQAAADLKKANDAKTAAEQAAAKAAEGQKAAEAKAAEAEKKAADAIAAATGIKKGATKAVKGQTFKATSSKAVTLTKVKNAKTVTVGSVVEINNQVYKVTALGKGALKAGKATKLTVDAQFLTKKGINADCAKGTGKIKTLVIKNQTKKAAPAKALVKAVKKYNKKVKVQYK